MARFQDEGGVVADGTFYVEREADRTLLERLREGRLCVVLAPRQIGKSSLRDRTQRRLADAGITAVHVDISAYTGADATEHWFYGGVIREIARRLGWDESRALADSADRPPDGWWNEFVQRELPERLDRRAVIFLDEIDSVRKLGFEPDALFTSIRLAMNRPPATFCLLGTMTPWEILRNPKAPPFNAGVQIRLEDFTADEARALLPGLAPLGDAEPLLDEVLAWTSGHPYLTQRLCAALVAAGSRDVAAIVDATLLQQHGDPLFAYTETAFDLYAGGPAGAALVELYGRLLRGERVAPDASNREQLELRVTGMAADRAAGGRAIAVRNRIYTRHFDDAWLKRRRMHRFLAAAVNHWRESKRTRGLLGRGDLDDVVEWASAQPTVSGEDAAFLVASQQAVDRRRRVVRGNLLLAGTAAGLLLLLATVWLAVAERRATADLAAQGRTISSLTQHIDELKAQQKNEIDSLKAQLAATQQLADSRKQLNDSIQASLDKFNASLALLEQEKATLQAHSKRNIDDLRQQLASAEGAAQLAASDSEVLQRQAQTSAAAAARAKTDADAATRQATAAADLARRTEEARASLEQQLQQARLALDAMEARARVAEAARTSAETALAAAQSQTTATQNQLTTAQNQLTALQAAVASYCQKLASPPKPPCP